MAFTYTQNLVDTYGRTVVKRVNSANAESAALFVNASALGYALTTLNLTAGANNFKIGETVTSAAGGTGIVQHVVNSTAVNIINANGTFGAANVLTGGTSTKTRVQSGAAVPGARTLSVSKLIYNIGGPAEAKLQIDWEGDGTSNHRPVAVLSGSGVLELDQLAVRVVNDAVNATGNLLISTVNWNTNTHYTLIVDIGKMAGYSGLTLEQNGQLGY